jgi:hypothetical protein
MIERSRLASPFVQGFAFSESAKTWLAAAPPAARVDE